MQDQLGVWLIDQDFRDQDLANTLFRGCRFSGCDFSRADLSVCRFEECVDLYKDRRRMDCTKARLGGAVFDHSDLNHTCFAHADLTGCSFIGGGLVDANFDGATLNGTRFTGAELTRAYFGTANLREANLAEIKEDFTRVAAHPALIHELPDLRQALVAGKIDGSVYDGECCCFIGTLAKSKGWDWDDDEGTFPEANDLGLIDLTSPLERWITGISKNDTPENNQIAAITLEWIDEILRNVKEHV